MTCLWSRHVKGKADIAELVKFASVTKFERIDVAREEFTDLSEVCSYLEDCVIKSYVPWVAVFKDL